LSLEERISVQLHNPTALPKDENLGTKVGAKICGKKGKVLHSRDSSGDYFFVQMTATSQY
jgi:hypothetical protein